MLDGVCYYKCGSENTILEAGRLQCSNYISKSAMKIIFFKFLGMSYDPDQAVINGYEICSQNR